MKPHKRGMTNALVLLATLAALRPADVLSAEKGGVVTFDAPRVPA